MEKNLDDALRSYLPKSWLLRSISASSFFSQITVTPRQTQGDNIMMIAPRLSSKAMDTIEQEAEIESQALLAMNDSSQCFNDA